MNIEEAKTVDNKVRRYKEYVINKLIHLSLTLLRILNSKNIQKLIYFHLKMISILIYVMILKLI
jgi:hypothetical protein